MSPRLSLLTISEFEDTVGSDALADTLARFFTAAVYLIAQIGKNFALPEEDQIEGSELLMAAMNVFCETKKAIGGKLVTVERESDRPKLLEFYNDNGFKSWTTRRNAKDGMVYDQMFAVLDGK